MLGGGKACEKPPVSSIRTLCVVSTAHIHIEIKKKQTVAFYICLRTLIIGFSIPVLLSIVRHTQTRTHAHTTQEKKREEKKNQNCINHEQSKLI